MTDVTRLRVRGLLLIVGALVVGLVIEPVGSADLYWMPLIIGLTYLAASAAGGSTGGLWVPGLMVTFWGLADVLVLSGTWHVDFASAAISGIGIGAVLSLGLARLGVPVHPAAIAVNLLLIGLLELAEAQIGGPLRDGWPWALLLLLGALWELRPAVTLAQSSSGGHVARRAAGRATNGAVERASCRWAAIESRLQASAAGSPAAPAGRGRRPPGSVRLDDAPRRAARVGGHAVDDAAVQPGLPRQPHPVQARHG